MSLKSDMRQAEATIARLERRIAACEDLNAKRELLILMMMNDVLKATKIAEFRNIQKAMRELADVRQQRFSICLPIADDEELVMKHV